MARMMITHIPKDGPESQFQRDTPSIWKFAQDGALCTPKAPRIVVITPSWSYSQLGPVIPKTLRTLLTTPVVENKKMKTVVMAIELVTEGK